MAAALRRPCPLLCPRVFLGDDRPLETGSSSTIAASSFVVSDGGCARCNPFGPTRQKLFAGRVPINTPRDHPLGGRLPVLQP
jgi:hypothetical protein